MSSRLLRDLMDYARIAFEIVVIENHDVLGAAAGGVWELTGLVAENLAGNGHRFGKHTMGLDIGIGRDGRRRHVVWWQKGG